MNSSLSLTSIAILKSKGLDLFNDALSDPVKMLKLIDDTHRQSDNSNKVNSLMLILTCKADQYEDFPSHIAAFNRYVQVASDMFGSAKTTETQELFNDIFKCILTMNVDQTFFQFVIQSLNAANAPCSLIDTEQKFMSFYKNSSNPEFALMASQRLGSSVRRQRKPKVTVQSICKACHKLTDIAVNTLTNIPHEICYSCFKASKPQVPLTPEKQSKAPVKAPVKAQLKSPVKAVSKPSIKPLSSLAASAMQTLGEEDESD